MSGTAHVERPAPTVFLSYASEDRQAARRLGEALPTYGLEVWYDESELGGGDAWDQKIRRQIRDCDYFLALISAQTEARHEGYFRREWRMAVERTLDMADDHTFLLPMVIDDTAQAGARVPEKFLAVQWLRVPGGEPTPALEALCRRLAAGEAVQATATRRPIPRQFQPQPQPQTQPQPQPQSQSEPESQSQPSGKAAKDGEAAKAPFPEFPREEPGQQMAFFFHVVGWVLRSMWVLYKRQRRWLRILITVWLVGVLFSKGCSPTQFEHAAPTPEKIEKMKGIAHQLDGADSAADLAKVGAQIAREFSDQAPGKATRSRLLVAPFTAPSGDSPGAKLAKAAFTATFAKLSVLHGGTVGLEPLSSGALSAGLEQARTKHALYLLWGGVEGEGAGETLAIKILDVKDGSVEWSQSYATANADPAKIAADVDANIPSLDEDD